MLVGTLNQEQVRFFKHEGYYRLPSVYSPDETAAMRRFVRHQVASHRDEISDQLGFSGRLYALYQRDPAFMSGVVRHENLIGPLTSLLGENVVMTLNRHNHATMNDQRQNKEEGLHRDILQPTRGLITAAVYLEESTVAKAATRVVPGSEFFPYVAINPRTPVGTTAMADHDVYAGLRDQEAILEMPEGGVLLFTGVTFHGVGKQTTDGSRMSMTFGFRADDELRLDLDPLRELMVAGAHRYIGNDVRPGDWPPVRSLPS
jgi:ectoine hydroxylase-related dioxygenase (phytanoyl-CoA dioxygenase family)